MRNRRDRRTPNKLVIHLTTRTAYGLPFLPRRYMNTLLLGIIARGQSLFPVQIVAMKVMANHLHLILAGRANLISAFMNYIKGEIAQAIKRIFPGLYQCNVWHDRPHEQVLATPDDVLDKIAYLYANAARAGQVNSIREFKGVSTWSMFHTGSHREEHPWIRRSKLKSLPKRLSLDEETKLLKKWKHEAKIHHSLSLSPYIWRKCFSESRSWTAEEVYQKVVSRLADKEEQARAARTIRQPFTQLPSFNDPRCDYKPTKKSITPFIQCNLPELRRQYIERYRIFCLQLQAIAWKLKRGLLKTPEQFRTIPLGGYLPGGLLSSLLRLSLLPSG